MILRKLKRLLGLGSGDDGGRAERDVTMQERGDADAGNEAAVKGVGDGDSAESDAAGESADEGGEESTTEESEPTDESAEESEPTDESAADEADEPVAAETDADASTESLVDEEIAQEEPAGRAEPAEAAGPESDDETTDVESTDVAVEEEPTEAADDSPPVDEIRGIGPAYSERLGEIGISTVADLVGADAEEIAERTTAPEKTVRKWIDRANDHE